MAAKSQAQRDVEITREAAREMLDRYGAADIHNHAAVIEGYAALRRSLEMLLADLDALDAADGGA